jgi:hypothetical protein
MSRLADSLTVGTARQAAGLAPRTKLPTVPATSCVRCGGLLVTSFTASLERDATGTPVTLRRCVNCGDCVDPFILANRGKGPGPVVMRVGLPRGPQQTGRPRHGSVNGSFVGKQAEG